MMKSIVVMVLAVASAFCPAVSSADDVVVDWDGLLPPYISRLQDGIDAVSDGGTVYVTASLSIGADSLRFRGSRNRGLDFGGKNITLQAFGGPEFVIDCEGLDRAIRLTAGTDSTSHIAGFTFVNGSAADGGGSIRCDGGSPRISDCVFRNNSTSGDGGAITLSQGTTRITDCEFYSNTATGGGGAIYATDSDLTLRACTFSDNTADGGGAVRVHNSSLDIKLCTLANNEGSPGSGLMLLSSTATVEQCVLAFGRAGRSVYGGTPEIFHCCVYGNTNGDDLPGNAHDNLFVDPLLCDLYGVGGGNMSLCSNSLCLLPNNPWSLQVGSRAQGCADCDTPVEGSSWGGIKALFR